MLPTDFVGWGWGLVAPESQELRKQWEMLWLVGLIPISPREAELLSNTLQETRFWYVSGSGEARRSRGQQASTICSFGRSW